MSIFDKIKQLFFGNKYDSVDEQIESGSEFIVNNEDSLDLELENKINDNIVDKIEKSNFIKENDEGDFTKSKVSEDNQLVTETNDLDKSLDDAKVDIIQQKNTDVNQEKFTEFESEITKDEDIDLDNNVTNFGKSISIYYLRNHGLSKLLADRYSEDKIQLLDLFFSNSAKLLELTDNKKKKLSESLNECLPLIKKNTDVFDSVQLLDSVGKLGTGKFSKLESISDFRHEFSINTDEDWKQKGMLAASEKVKELVNKYDSHLKDADVCSEMSKWHTFVYFLNHTYASKKQLINNNINPSIVNEMIDDGYLVNDKNNQYVMLAIDNLNFVDKLSELFNLDVDFYKSNRIDVNELKKENAITLSNFLKTDGYRNDILSYYLDHNLPTLQEMGDEFGITRERIRQILIKIKRDLPEIKEVIQYEDVYTTYDISKDFFVNVFCSDEKVYEMLAFVFDGKKGYKDKGNQDIVEFVLADDNFSSNQKQYALKVKEDREKQSLKKRSKRSLAVEILADNHTPMSEVDVYQRLCELYPNRNFYNSRSVGSLLRRDKEAIFSINTGYRYRQSNNDSSLLTELGNKFKNLDDGAYSMNYVFDNNRELMDKLDILDGSELHNAVKEIFELNIPNVELGRNPEFVKGDLTKREYVFHELRKFDGQQVTKFAKYMNNKYGLHEGTIAAYITAEFSNHILNSSIYFNSHEYTELVEKIKPYLGKPFYSVDVFNSIIKNHVAKIPDDEEFIYELGYMERSDIIVSTKYNSATAALSEYILNNKIFSRDVNNPLFKTVAYTQTITRLVNDLKVIKIDDNKYINMEYLEHRGFDKNIINVFVKNVENNVNDDYFTIESIRKKGFKDEIFGTGLEDITLDDLIHVSDDFYTVTQSYPHVYCRNSSKRYLKDFFYSELTKIKVADINELTENINDNYGLDFDKYVVQARLVEMGAFYSPELQRIYLNKEDYLDEVYDK